MLLLFERRQACFDVVQFDRLACQTDDGLGTSRPRGLAGSSINFSRVVAAAEEPC